MNQKKPDMIKRILVIPAITFICLLPASAQVKKQETVLKREVTLYNPYKPSLPVVQKRSFLPDMKDTSRVNPNFRYNIKTEPFLPAYTISPIKAAALLPDPLPKLYKSYVNIGMGNYITPLAEISITNDRSKKGTVGLYVRHYSTNGNIKLENNKKVFAGYMDNDASLFGRKFFRNNILEGSTDFSQKNRYAYGYDPNLVYSADKKETLNSYYNMGAKASLTSITLDSTSLSYNFDMHYNYFFNTSDLYQHNFGFEGIMSKSFKDFYVGSGIAYDYYKLSDFLSINPKNITSLSPFIMKSNEQWSFKLGFQALIEDNMAISPELHIYPDINIGLSIVPSYIRLIAGLSGKLEKNDPLKVIEENPYLVQDGRMFELPNTDHQLIAFTGLSGNTGIGGNYLVSASYSLINNMLFYSNIEYPASLALPPQSPEMGNHFITLADDVELLTIHGEISGKISDKISYNGKVSLYKYTLSKNDLAWNKPNWDAKIGFKYNLRDKILIGIDLTGTGKRKLMVSKYELISPPTITVSELQSDYPAHINLNLIAEYRYSKILSFWTKFNNISFDRYYEWAFYPSQRFQFMLGFTYSL
jgi:hypothetical protein